MSIRWWLAVIVWCLPGVSFAVVSAPSAVSTKFWRAGATYYPTTGAGVAMAAVDLAAVAVSAGRWAGWGGAIAVGSLGYIALKDWQGDKGLDLIPAGVTPPYYPGGSSNPPASSAEFPSSYPAVSGVNNENSCDLVSFGSCVSSGGFEWCRFQGGVMYSGYYSVNNCVSKPVVNGYYTIIVKKDIPHCGAGYTWNGWDCLLTDPSIVKYDSIFASRPVYHPYQNNDGTTGWKQDSRDPNVAPINAVPASGPIVRDGVDSQTGQPARETVTPLPNGGIQYNTSVQTVNSGNQSWTINNSVTYAGNGAVTETNSSTTPGTPAQASTAVPAEQPLAVDPTTGKVVTAQSGNGTGQMVTVSNMPADYAKNSTVESVKTSVDALKTESVKTNTKLDQLHTDLSDPGTAAGDPIAPSIDEFKAAYFGDTFTDLLAWQLPGHSSVCPEWGLTVPYFNWRLSAVAHCQVWRENGSALSAVMVAAWSVAALFLLLKA